MSSLSKEQKDLLLDFYFKCGSEEDLIRASELIATNSDAAELYDKLDGSLGIMDGYREESCPEHLVAATLSKFQEITAAAPPKTPLERLIESQRRQNGTFATAPWASFAKIAAMAALIAIVAAVYYPVTAQMRHMSYKASCNRNLSQISVGLAGYTNDNLGRLPQVGIASSGPWWKVGAQGGPNQSNTRNIWLLVKGDYAKLNNFICPGNQTANKAVDISSIEIDKYANDFPGTEFIDYSFKLMSEDCQKTDLSSDSVIAADANPLFDNFRESELDSFQKFRVNNELLKKASKNHARTGQNVLFVDGSVRFSRDRNINGDDIYTIQGELEYSGDERPASFEDTFLVP